MPALEPAPVVIACPNCGMRYQVSYATIGPKGRSVQCAHCGKSWHARAEPPPPPPPPEPPQVVEPPVRALELADKDFGALAEEMLDEKFVIEEQRHRARREAAAKAEADAKLARTQGKKDAAAAAAAAAEAASQAEAEASAAAIGRATAGTIDGGAPEGDGAERSDDHQRTLDDIKAAIAPKAKTAAPPEKLDPAARKRQQQEFSRRQRSMASRLPAARIRRAARIAAGLVIVLVVGGGTVFRTLIVQQFPQLAGLYAAVGLGVNVIGLEFHDVTTLQSLRDGDEVLTVSGRISSAANQEEDVPQVIVTLLGKDGMALYEWSMTPKATSLEPGESIAFDTQLSKPPAGATGVKLTFANGRTQSGPAESPVYDASMAPPANTVSAHPTSLPAPSKGMGGGWTAAPAWPSSPTSNGKTDDASYPDR